ncbi:MAG TPA: hypothetical protein VNU73_07350 [Steroidobacteraceae bacterium]|nr:hypothetical protein [Steroidobacteraceae bacterium]
MGRILNRTRSLRRAVWTCALVLLVLATPAARATDWQLSVDARLIDSDGQRSFLDGGLGTLRFGDNQSGLRLGRARLALDQPIGQILALKVDASAWGDHDKSPVGLTEAYLELRPYPLAGWRVRVKAGAFYAPISLENTAPGWESPYTVAFSALDSWVAEELRTIGLETRIEWLGTHLGYDFDAALIGSVFGWNEPAGVGLATHGFAFDDRQTTLFGRVGLPFAVPVGGVQEFREIDGRAGIYGGVELRYLDRVLVRALHYDNQANPSAFDPILGAHAWETRFDTVGIRAELPGGWTGIYQWLEGETYVSPIGVEYQWAFNTSYALLSKRIGKHTLSARLDAFSVSPAASTPFGTQTGHAGSVAYVYQHDTHLRITLEWLRVRSYESNRMLFLGESPFATESAVTLAVRYAIGTP